MAAETLPQEDPARIDRLRPEFADHASVEAIDARLRGARRQLALWERRVQMLATLRQTRVEQMESGEWPTAEAVEETHVVADDSDAPAPGTCRCFAPTLHAPDCIKAITHWGDRTFPAGVWYRDADGEWWLPVAVDDRGCLALQLDGDPEYTPTAVDELEAEHGPLTATTHASTLSRTDLPTPQ
ncbi:hypothetical protein [Streptomyces sp. NPDC101145]|uniref:hypothetical protein n=1 Tax=Streptomyces sp. NPDC101145 TaxID=3366112 RepID=UPI003808928D